MSENYSQPDFYHFNEDSIKLAKWISQAGILPISILDLGAGSGIIGIELARILSPNELTLVELQKEFLPHLQKNCQDFLPKKVAFSIIIKAFLDFIPEHKFDLIVCNPPYYLPGRGELPQNSNRAMARTFLVDSWVVLLKTINISLATEGKAFIVLKQDKNLFESISMDASSTGLMVKKNELDSLMILELFRLNKNRD